MTVILPVTSRYTAKDQLKADYANKFIGRGSQASSTNQYALAYGAQANSSRYVEEDVVFVSVEGARRNRIPLDHVEVAHAVAVGARFLSDTSYHRNRPYNVGERELATLLEIHGYVAMELNEFTVWSPA